jgi:hypothetical protein
MLCSEADEAVKGKKRQKKNVDYKALVVLAVAAVDEPVLAVLAVETMDNLCLCTAVDDSVLAGCRSSC